MGEVHDLKIVRPNDPDPDVVEFLEGLLKRARAGHVLAVAVAYVTHNGCITDGWSGGYGGKSFALAGAIACLQHRFIASLNSVEPEAPPPLESA